MKHYKRRPALTHEKQGPILESITCHFADGVDYNQHPFSLDIIKNLKEILLPSQVTFFIGENGTGKSTILEAIACHAGFGLEGGSKNFSFTTSDPTTYTAAHSLADQLRLSWRVKPKNGYFFRAESFFNIANYIDELAKNGGPEDAYRPYGGKSLHAQSHGESFLSFFHNRLGSDGFFIFDEPEAALSPQRQLSLLVIIHQMCKNPGSQFIIATHSPLLLAYPGATIYSCDNDTLVPIAYQDTEHYKITKDFLNNPEQYLHHLFS